MTSVLQLQTRTNHLTTNLMYASLLLKLQQNGNRNITRSKLYNFVKTKLKVKRLDIEYFYKVIRKLVEKGMIKVNPDSKIIEALDHNLFADLNKKKIIFGYYNSIQAIIDFGQRFHTTKYSLAFSISIFNSKSNMINFYQDFKESLHGLIDRTRIIRESNQSSNTISNFTNKLKIENKSEPPYISRKGLSMNKSFITKLAIFGLIYEREEFLVLSHIGKQFWELLDNYYWQCDEIDILESNRMT